MAIAFGTAGAVGTGTTSLPLAYPTGLASGDLLVMFIANKYPTNTPSLPSGGWFSPSGNQYSRGGGTPGADTGDVYITLYLKLSDGTETGNVSVTVTGANTSIGRIFQYTKAASKDWDYVCAGGSDNVAGTTWSALAGSDPGVTANDNVLVGSAICGNTDTATSEAITQTGVTFGTMVERQDSGSNGGDDISMWVTEHPVSSGTGVAAPLYTATVAGTGSANAAGASLFLRLREVDAPISGTLTQTLDTVTLVATATVDVVGTLSKTLDTVTLAATGTVDVVGTLTQTLDTVTLVAEGTVGAAAIEGTLTKTLDTVTLTATGTVDTVGTLSKTLDTVTLAATGAVDTVGTLFKTLDDATLLSTGAVDIVGTLSKTLDTVTLSSIGAVDTVGTLTKTLDDVGFSSEGTVGSIPIEGTLTKTLDPATLSSTGAVDTVGTLSKTLDNATVSSTGAVDIAGTLSKTLDPATLTSTATVDIVGVLTQTLDPATLLAAGTVTSTIEGVLSKTLDPATIFAAGEVLVSGVLADAILEATGGEQAGISGELIATLEDVRTGYPQHYLSESRVFGVGRTSQSMGVGRKSRVH